MLVCLIVVVILLYAGIGGVEDGGGDQVRVGRFGEFIGDAVRELEMPRKYIGVQDIKTHQQLPICLIIDIQSSSQSNIVNQSIQTQNYQNYKKSYIDFSIFKTHNKTTLTPSSLISPSTPTSTPTLKSLHQQLKSDCLPNSILTFISSPLSMNSLWNINNYFQVYNAWMLYNISDIGTHDGTRKERIVQNVEIVAVYQRIFQFVDNNRFDSSQQLVEMELEPVSIMTALFQMCRYYAKYIKLAEIRVEVQSQSLLAWKYDKNTQQSPKIRRTRYQNLHNLYQNYKIKNIGVLNSNRKKFFSANQTLTQNILFYYRTSKFTQTQFQQALQFTQLTYLPHNHSLNKIQLSLLNSKFNIEKHPTELPLCIDIKTHNNIENERYKKVLDSVISQNYKNYHIVLTDDFSDDETLLKSKQYIQKQLDLDMNRITFVRNKVQKFATFNMINTAFNYCKEDEIQVIIDGDDQLVGRQVFKLINAEFQNKDIWIMNTFYINDKYVEGITVPYQPQFINYDSRKLVFFYGPLRAFKVSLFRHIPLHQHLDYNDQFLVTMCDTASQYSLYQLSGPQHSSYTHYIPYHYFSSYGANDDSNMLKITYRNLLNLYISFRKPLRRLKTLAESVTNKQITQILQKQRGITYEQIK